MVKEVFNLNNGYSSDVLYDILKPLEIKESFPNEKYVLRAYQEEAVKSMIKHRRGVIQLPTGAGKTLVALEFLRRVSLPAIYIVNRKDLFYQTIKYAKDFGFSEVGCIGDGLYNPTFKLDVAMLQTLNKMVDVKESGFFDKYQVVIVDECHHINFDAKKNKETLSAFTNAFYRFGFSATPFRYEGKKAEDITLMAVIGVPIYTQKEIEQFTAPVRIYFIKLNYEFEDRLMNVLDLAYREALNLVLSLEERMEIIKQIVNAHKEDKVLLIAPSVNHALALGKFLDIPVVYGELSSNERQKLYNQFKGSEIKHLIATTVYDEGVDFPDLNVLVLTEPFKSYLKIIQRVGRGRRISKGKNYLLVYDLVDQYFKKQYWNRAKVYRNEGFTILTQEEITLKIKSKKKGEDVYGVSVAF